MSVIKLRPGVLVFFMIGALLILGGCEGENNQNLISGTESILNSGFETGVNRPQSWFPFCDRLETGLSFNWDEQTAKTGAKCIQLKSSKPNYTGWVQIVLLKANTNYRLSGWIKTENIRPSTAFNPKMTHNIGANLAVVDDVSKASKSASGSRGAIIPRIAIGPKGTASGGGGKWRIHSSGLLGSNPWTYVELTFNSGSHTQIKIMAQLGIWGGPTTGTAWFDDLKLQKI
ncbi:MAG TPA: hypothetical protein VHY08_07360 [Bacillota bacterium]|nr:hypothetical protein [Bacillota bacterium]